MCLFGTLNRNFFFLCQISYPKQGKLCISSLILYPKQRSLFAYTLSKGRSIGKNLVTSSDQSKGKHDEEALLGNRFVGIPFIFTDLYDLPTLPRTNVFDTLNRQQYKSTLFKRFAVAHGVQITIEVTPPPPPVKHDEQIKRGRCTHLKNTCLGCVLHPEIHVSRSFRRSDRTSPPKKMSDPGDAHRYQVMAIIYFNVNGIENYLTKIYIIVS